jgi:tetratricopeptide (TPR) repeat protein
MQDGSVEDGRMSMFAQPDLSTEDRCRELLARYPDNGFLKDRLAEILRSQGREEEATALESDTARGDGKYHYGLLGYDEWLRDNPSDAVAYLNRGLWHRWHGEWSRALSDYYRAIDADRRIAHAFCCRACLRATCPDDEFRDGPKAVADALTAMRLAEGQGKLIGDWRERLYLQVLAAAHAENGEFDEAVAFQTKALDVALTITRKVRIAEILAAYRDRRPWRSERGLVSTGFTPSV